jgi:hypothetical protein
MLKSIVKNSVVKAFLKGDEFRKSKSSTRYTVLWASKFHTFINEIMRSKSFEEQQKRLSLCSIFYS